ncbi:tRNA (adenosine(37)-N6)-threonylcarbamoyltransferase complex ATPase subunit type 1 TsaE, partial [Helicobacter pylori]
EWGDEKLEKILKKYDLAIKVVEIKTESTSRFYTIKIA